MKLSPRKFKSSSNFGRWRSFATYRSAVHIKERAGFIRKKDTVYSSCFYPKEEGWIKGMPKNKGRRLHLENLGDK